MLQSRMLQSQLPVVNKILGSLPRSDYPRLLPRLELVELSARDVLCEPGDPLRYVYFPADALLTLLHLVDEKEVFSVALVGRDGIAGGAVVMGAQQAPFRVLVLGAGMALRMKAKVFAQEFRSSELLRDAALRYLLQLTMQISDNAACNRFHVIEERLARWLLMMRDRCSSGHFHITHELMGHLLGVRRVGITNAAQSLKQRALIDYSRGAMDIVDPIGLKKAACGCYRMAEGRHGKT
jgi:CRP-like cAMP-binding protein